MKTKNAKQPLPGDSLARTEVNFRNAFLLTGATLHPLAMDYQSSHPPVEKKFRSQKEFEQLVFENDKTLFGQNIFFMPFGKKYTTLFSSGFVPTALLFDMSNAIIPRLLIVDSVSSAENFYGHIFARMTSLISLLRNQYFTEAIISFLEKDKLVRKELEARRISDNISEYLMGAMNKAGILLITDGEIKELPAMATLYADAWKIVKPIMLKKYSSNGHTLITMQPTFAELNERGKSPKTERPPSTEEDHLKDVSDAVRASYGKIKTDLLKINRELQFNPQTYYISLKKDTNLAFFHIGKKRISLVVKHPEKDTKKLIKHHEVKTLTEKVQKFWNGPSCTIVIENEKHLNEVTGLLKKMIAS